MSKNTEESSKADILIEYRKKLLDLSGSYCFSNEAIALRSTIDLCLMSSEKYKKDACLKTAETANKLINEISPYIKKNLFGDYCAKDQVALTKIATISGGAAMEFFYRHESEKKQFTEREGAIDKTLEIILLFEDKEDNQIKTAIEQATIDWAAKESVSEKFDFKTFYELAIWPGPFLGKNSYLINVFNKWILGESDPMFQLQCVYRLEEQCNEKLKSMEESLNSLLISSACSQAALNECFGVSTFNFGE